MAKEFRILHHRATSGGGNWFLLQNPFPFRIDTAGAPHGEGTLCAALQTLAEDGWNPVVSLEHATSHSSETALLLARD